MEINDLSAALRAMADNVDVLTERHDVAQMAQLRHEAAEHVVQARRDADVIDELRRQVTTMGRQLDAIGRMRKDALTRGPDSAQILTDALLIIDGPCHEHTRRPCRDSSRTRDAQQLGHAWCPPCVARDALERAGALPSAVD